MKNQFRTALSLVLALLLTILAGCGKDKPAPTETVKVTESRPISTKATVPPTKATVPSTKPTVPPTTAEPTEPEPEPYSLSAYFDNDECQISLNFYDDFTVVVSDIGDYFDGVYYFVEDYFQMVVEDVTYEGYVSGDELILNDFEGSFHQVDGISYYPSNEPEPTVPDDIVDNKKFKSLDNGCTRYYDYDGHIAISYPDWMENLEDELMPGSVLISDGAGGFVLGINLTDAYWDYSGSNDEFALELYNTIISDAFTKLYGGGWEVYDYTKLNTVKESQLAKVEANIYNENYDICVYTSLYRTLKDGAMTDHVIAKIFFSNYEDENHLKNLRDQVTDCVYVY